MAADGVVFVDVALAIRLGNVLGQHSGYEKFTVGQRKGLGITFGEPRFVIRVDAESRQVVLGQREDLATNTITATGLNWLTDDFDTNFGFNATYGAEWFPAKPWVLNSSMDWGRIGATSLLHLRNTVGITKSGWGVYAGHDYLRIADNSIHS